jgi:hypothetical protein
MLIRWGLALLLAAGCALAASARAPQRVPQALALGDLGDYEPHGAKRVRLDGQSLADYFPILCTIVLRSFPSNRPGTPFSLGGPGPSPLGTGEITHLPANSG